MTELWDDGPNGLRYLREWEAGELIRDRWYMYYDEGKQRREIQDPNEYWVLQHQGLIQCEDDPLVVQAGHHKCSRNHAYPTQEQLEQLWADVEQVWNHPADKTHLNQADCNLFAWVSGLKDQHGKETDRNQYILCFNRTKATVAGRMRIRKAWLSILEQMGIPLLDPSIEFRGFKDQVWVSQHWAEFLHRHPVGSKLQFNVIDAYDRYSYFVCMYADIIRDKDPTLETFCKLAERAVADTQ